MGATIEYVIFILLFPLARETPRVEIRLLMPPQARVTQIWFPCLNVHVFRARSTCAGAGPAALAQQIADCHRLQREATRSHAVEYNRRSRPQKPGEAQPGVRQECP